MSFLPAVEVILKVAGSFLLLLATYLIMRELRRADNEDAKRARRLRRELLDQEKENNTTTLPNLFRYK